MNTNNPEGINLFDVARVQAELQQKVEKRNFDKQEAAQLADEMASKITTHCEIYQQELIQVEWKSKADLAAFYTKVQKLSAILVSSISLTFNYEDSDKHAVRWANVVRAFFDMFLFFLDECEKHTEGTAGDKPKLLAQSELEEYQLILEDDFVQEVDALNSRIFDQLLLQSNLDSRIMRIISDYR